MTTTKIDPRFRRESKKKNKVVLDSRFKGMFTDEDFISPVTLDKYGRKIDSNEEKNNLERFYRLDDDENGSETLADNAVASCDDDGDGDFQTNITTSTTDNNTDDDSDEEVLEGQHAMEEILSSHPLVNENIPSGEPTERLAVMNLDWDAIRADDIFTLANAFKPQIGRIISCQVYPSSFGKERMQRESVEGPAKEIFTEKERPDDGEDYNSESLRKYQFERMRYYYAVIVCDSVETAKAVYRNCDGNEFERSANYLDFRYIPPHVTFSPVEDGPLHSECYALPENYTPKHSLVTEALQSSKVSLTWDKDDQHRATALKQGNSRIKASSAEVDLSAYLASSSSEDDGDDDDDNHHKNNINNSNNENLRDEYRKKLLSSTPINVFERPSRSGDEGGDMEITFTGAFDNLSQSSEGENDDRDDPTPFTKYLARREEKSKKEKVPEKVVNPTKKDKRLKRKKKEEEERDLALLVDDDDDEEEEFSSAVKASKKSSSTKTTTTRSSGSGTFFDANDPRFEEIYKDSSYALDPSDPSFRRTDGTEKMIKERQKRQKFTDYQ